MIIVTGGAGFIGSNIVKALNNKGITDIIIVDNLKNSLKLENLTNIKIIDFWDKKNFLKHILADKELGYIEAIFHKGACSSTIENNGNYIMNNNYKYSKILLKYSLKRKIPFIYASSAAIYGNKFSTFVESSEYEKPLNLYAYSKFLFDEYVRYILPNIKSQVVGLRYFNVYGPHECHKGNMASIIFKLHTQLKNGNNAKIFEGSEKLKRDFIFVEDVTIANIWFLEKAISGIFNIGTGYAVSFQNIAETMLKYYNKSNIEYIPIPNKLKKQYQVFTKADLTNLHNVGYKKKFNSITEGLNKYISWLKTIKD